MPDFKKLPTVNGAAVALADHVHPGVGLALWFDASQLTGLADSDPVATWPDVSGNGRSATQATAGNRPLYKTGIINGRPVVRFDGTNDALTTAAFGPLTQPTTIVMVYRFAVVPGGTVFVYDGIDAVNRQAAAADASTLYRYAGNLPGGGTPDTKTHVRSDVFAGAAGSTRQDGAVVFSGDDGGASLAGLTLGAPYSLLANFAQVDIAEVLVFDPGVSAADLRQIELSLAAKYELSPALSFASLTKWGTD